MNPPSRFQASAEPCSAPILALIRYSSAFSPHSGAEFPSFVSSSRISPVTVSPLQPSLSSNRLPQSCTSAPTLARTKLIAPSKCAPSRRKALPPTSTRSAFSANPSAHARKCEPTHARSPVIFAPSRRTAPSNRAPSCRKTLPPTSSPSALSANPSAPARKCEPTHARSPVIFAPSRRTSPSNRAPSCRKTLPPTSSPSASKPTARWLPCRLNTPPILAP